MTYKLSQLTRSTIIKKGPWNTTAGDYNYLIYKFYEGLIKSQGGLIISEDIK